MLEALGLAAFTTLGTKPVHIEVVIGQFESEFFGDDALATLDLWIDELLHATALDADDVVVMLVLGNLKDGMAAFKMVPDNQTRLLELRQDPVDRGKADLFVLLDKLLVHILRAQMMHVRTFQYLQNLNARQSNFQTSVLELLGFNRHGSGGSCKLDLVSRVSYAIGRTTLKAVALLIAALCLSGCSTYHFPGVHRITIQQGNVVTQTMIDKLKPGMTKSQVRFVMGNPIIDDPLDKGRWNYFYSIQIAGGTVIRRNLQLYFVDGRLSYFEGDFAPTKEKNQEKGATANS